MVSMTLTDMEGFKIGTEFSPRTLHGLSHREIGDHSHGDLAAVRGARAVPRRDARHHRRASSC